MNPPSKRVLFLSHYFPPMPTAGATRGRFLASLLPRFGWKPTVIAYAYPGPAPKAIDVEYVRNPLLRAAISAPANPASETELASRGSAKRRTARAVYRALVSAYFPDSAMGWIIPAYRRAAMRMQSEPFDAIISSAHPVSSHIVGAMLARRFGLPWIADYRDLWTGYPYSTDGPIRRSVGRELERRLIRDASAITTVSEDLRASLVTLHGRDDVIAIQNGSSVDDWDAAPLIDPIRCNVVYGGMLYNGMRSPETLFAGLAALRAAGDPAGDAITFDFYTNDPQVARNAANNLGIGDALNVFPVIDRAELLARQRAAAALAVILRTDASVKAEFGSKIFEYLNAGRPIVATGPASSPVADLLLRSALGRFATDATEAAGVLRWIYERFIDRRFNITPEPSFRPFTSVDLARSFADVLNKVAR